MGNVVLLGAGASRPAGIPTSIEMTDAIVDKLTAAKGRRREAHLARFVLGGLIFSRGIQDKHPVSAVDVEEFFEAAMLLGERTQSQIAPFVSGWHPVVEQFDRSNLGYEGKGLLEAMLGAVEKSLNNRVQNSPTVRSHDLRDAVARAIGEAGQRGSRIGEDLDRHVVDLVQESLDFWLYDLRATDSTTARFERNFQEAVEAVSVSRTGTAFKAFGKLIATILRELVWIKDTTKVAYLCPLLNNVAAAGDTIVTLNYDNSVELAAQTCNLHLDYTLDTASERAIGTDDTPVIPFLKLHGSMNWHRSSKRGPESVLPKRTTEVVSDLDTNADPDIVFGRRNKPTASGPFLDLLFTFRRKLDSARKLLVIGYSFRDEHVNEYISAWINGDPKRTVSFVDPRFAGNDGQYVKYLRKLGEDRLTVFEDSIDVVLDDAMASLA